MRAGVPGRGGDDSLKPAIPAMLRGTNLAYWVSVRLISRERMEGTGTVIVDGTAGMEVLEERVGEAARMLRLLANERRLLVLCHLLVRGEMSVGALAEAVKLSQPALSQHLAQMRAEGLVATRREAQTIWYRVADPKVERLVEVLHELYCPPI